MRPISLTLKGFRGIRDGLGRDVIELDFEKLADAIAQTPGPFIVAVRCCCAGIRVRERGGCFRAKARCIVARKFLAPLSHSCKSLPAFLASSNRMMPVWPLITCHRML